MKEKTEVNFHKFFHPWYLCYPWLNRLPNLGLKSSTIDQIQKQLDQCLLAYESQKIVFLQVDLTQATFVDSMGLNFLVYLAKRMEEKKIKFEIDVASPWIMRIFKAMKIDQWMNCRFKKS